MAVRATSLRIRLMVLLLVPLVVISAVAGYWRFTVAQATAQGLFDQTLTALTLAIARDVAISRGDLLSPTTLDLLQTASGGTVFYHVHGPDGGFVTGYAYPPVAPTEIRAIENVPAFFEATYRGHSVRVVRLTERATMDAVSGYATVTVWQDLAARESLARQLALRAALLMGSLILTVAAVVWFGVNLGLKPLTDLEEAIARRSSDDLSVIRRPVPREAAGIVRTLNHLFGQVSRAIAARDVFISDAAHQLRNPIAGILAMAEAARDAGSPAEARARTQELVAAARHATRLTQQFLSYERAKGQLDRSRFTEIDLNDLVRSVCGRNAERVLKRGVDFEFREHPAPVVVSGDEVLLSEAVENLIDNALMHGGPGNEQISVSVAAGESGAAVTVADAGIGLNADAAEAAFARFSTGKADQGSGLGLAIVKEIVAHHRGSVRADPVACGASFTIALTPIGHDRRV